MIVIYIANLLVVFAVAFLVYQRQSERIRKYFFVGFFYKLCAGIALGLVYTYYYKVGDTFSYFDDGVLLADFAQNNFPSYLNFIWRTNENVEVWKNLTFQDERSLFLVKIVSLLCLLTSNNYWLISIYFSFASFVGAWILVTAIAKNYPRYINAGLVSFLFLPSAVFWTSGLIKESLAMAGLYFLSALVVKIWNQNKAIFIECLGAVLAAWILWNLKYYYLAVFLPVASTAVVARLFVLPYLKLKTQYGKLLVWLGIFLIPLFVVSLLHPNFYPERFLEVIVENNRAFNNISDPADLIHFSDLQPTVSSVVRNSPQALLSGILRPFIWEAGTLFQFIIAVENTILFLAIFTSIFAWTKLKGNDKLFSASIILYIILLCVFLALSAPNFGTLSRYRVGFLPFLAFLSLIENPLFNRLRRA